MSVAVIRQNQTFLPIAGLQFFVTGLTAGSVNHLTLPGFPSESVVNGAVVFPLGASVGAACYDPSSTTFKKDPNDATQVLIDVYPTTVTEVGVFVW